MKRVLVIDDCADFREVVSDLLDDAGYKVNVAESAEQALKQCEAETFDIVLCDLVMPVPDEENPELVSDSAMVGVHTIHALSKKYPDLPIIAVSGQLTGDSLKGISQFGAVTSLAKPFGRDELMQAVESALNHAG